MYYTYILTKKQTNIHTNTHTNSTTNSKINHRAKNTTGPITISECVSLIPFAVAARKKSSLRARTFYTHTHTPYQNNLHTSIYTIQNTHRKYILYFFTNTLVSLFITIYTEAQCVKCDYMYVYLCAYWKSFTLLCNVDFFKIGTIAFSPTRYDALM